MYHPFSVPETIKTSWYIFRKNFVTIIVFSVISVIVLQFLQVIIQLIVSEEAFGGRMLIGFLFILIQAYTTLGLYKLIFTLIDSEYYEFEFKQVLPGFKMIVSYLAVGFILAFTITNFAILLEYLEKYPLTHDIVKGIIFIISFYLFLRIIFFITFIVDDHSGPIESLKQSFRLTKGYILRVLMILLIILVFIIAPAELSVYYKYISVLLAFTYPFVSIIMAVAYRKLIFSHQDVDDDITETV